MATSLLIIVANIKTVKKSNFSLTKQVIDILDSSLETNPTNSASNFECVLYIYYPVRFYKDLVDTKVLINLNSKVNAMHLIYAKKISFSVQKTDISA